MERKKRTDSNFLMQGSILAIASIISRVIGLLYRSPLTAIIGKTGNDCYGTAYEVYNIILILSSYSIPLAVSKLVATRMANKEYKNAWRVFKGALFFACTTGTIAMLIVFLGADFFCGTVLQTPLSAIALRILAPVLLVVAIVGVMRGFFQGLHTMVPSAFSQILEQIVNAIVSVVAAYYLFSYGSRVGAVLGDQAGIAAAYGAAGGTTGTAIGAVFALLFMTFMILIYRRVIKKKMRRDRHSGVETYGNIMKVLVLTIVPVLLSTTLYNVSAIIDQGIFKNIVNIQGYDKHQISEWWGVFAGQYIVLINVPISIASAMAASSVPSLASAYQEGNVMMMQRRIRLATRFIMLIAFPCTIGMAVLGGPIMQLLFMDSDITSAYMMQIGAIPIIFFSWSTLSNGLLQGINQMRIPVRNAAIALVAQIVFLVAMLEIFHLNIFAVVLANAFYGFMMAVLNHMALKKYSGANLDVVKTFVIPAGAACVMGVVVWLCYKLVFAITSINAIGTILSIVVGMFVYFVLMILMRGITESELRTLPKGVVLIQIAKKLHLM
ncbi:MAG: polysaccharide biosynthesis protein [Lachnospiraceae bacterium]|nr:polysaccharide biosynthesis protein [Lachnospiraceae bacterium]